MGALGSIAIHAENSVAIAAAGGIQRIIGVLRAATSRGLQEDCACALFNLSRIADFSIPFVAGVDQHMCPLPLPNSPSQLTFHTEAAQRAAGSSITNGGRWRSAKRSETRDATGRRDRGPDLEIRAQVLVRPQRAPARRPTVIQEAL